MEIVDVVCEAETDKSTIEVESSAGGTVLKLLYQAGEEVPVMQPMMIVGQKGEQVSVAPEAEAPEVSGSAPVSAGKASSQEVPVTVSVASAGAQGVSPRARAASLAMGIDPASISASGPKGRVIERDVVAAASARAPLSPVAKEALAQGGLQSPAQGSESAEDTLDRPDIPRGSGLSHRFPRCIVPRTDGRDPGEGSEEGDRKADARIDRNHPHSSR